MRFSKIVGYKPFLKKGSNFFFRNFRSSHSVELLATGGIFMYMLLLTNLSYLLLVGNFASENEF